MSREEITRLVERGHAVQAHRGPDMTGQYVEVIGDIWVVLGHQRLSIIDLSDSGRQPMASASGRSVIAYNGEVYNYLELAESAGLKELRGHSDTEVILERLEAGADPASVLAKFNGMWAFAMLARESRRLWLSRDRAGVKPLYLARDERGLFFASEIKTLLSLKGGRHRIDRQALGEFLVQSLQDSSTRTMFEGIRAFPAGAVAAIELADRGLACEPQSYWDPFSAPDRQHGDPVAAFRELFDDAVRLRLRADVPVGVMLSGGLDSSAITVATQALLPKGMAPRILSAVSPGSRDDESPYIDMLAMHCGLGVEKVELGWSATDAFALLHRATWHNDAPLGSFSNVAHYLLMRKAAELGIKVILSGQGADELLCGYRKYLGFYLKSLIAEGRIRQALFVLWGFAANGTVLTQFDPREAKRYIRLPGWRSGEGDILTDEVRNEYRPVPLGAGSQGLARRQFADYRSLSVPFLTHYEDRMSMAAAREIRLPFLDYRLVELLLSLPPEWKLRKGWTKYLMRVALSDRLPPGITWRKDKQGFVNPQAEWLRTSLRSTTTEYFQDSIAARFRLVDRQRLLKRYQRYVSGDVRIWYRDVFNPLALEIWLREFGEYVE